MEAVRLNTIDGITTASQASRIARSRNLGYFLADFRIAVRVMILLLARIPILKTSSFYIQYMIFKRVADRTSHLCIDETANRLVAFSAFLIYSYNPTPQVYVRFSPHICPD
jgi:hypothetical protein